MAFVRAGEVLHNRRHVFTQSRKVVDAMLIVSSWAQIIEDVNCVEKFKRTKAIHFKNGALTVIAASATLAAELKMCEAKILLAYAKRLKHDIVKRLCIKRG